MSGNLSKAGHKAIKNPNFWILSRILYQIINLKLLKSKFNLKFMVNH